MNQRQIGRGPGSSWLHSLLLAVFFFLGILAGIMCACRASAQISEELSAYLSAYLNAVRQRTSSPDVGCSLAAMYIWGPALAFLLAFTGIGAVLLPLLTAAYGFFPAYAVSCMAASFGRQGVLMAAVFFGLRCLITFPCFFLLAVPSWEAAVVRFRASFGRGGQPQMLAAAYRCVFDPVFGDLAGSSAVAGSSAGAAGTDILGYFRRWRL